MGRGRGRDGGQRDRGGRSKCNTVHSGHLRRRRPEGHPPCPACGAGLAARGGRWVGGGWGVLAKMQEAVEHGPARSTGVPGAQGRACPREPDRRVDLVLARQRGAQPGVWAGPGGPVAKVSKIIKDRFGSPGVRLGVISLTLDPGSSVSKKTAGCGHCHLPALCQHRRRWELAEGPRVDRGPHGELPTPKPFLLLLKNYLFSVFKCWPGSC